MDADHPWNDPVIRQANLDAEHDLREDVLRERSETDGLDEPDIGPAALIFLDPFSAMWWTVRLVRQGERYGNALCLTHDDERPTLHFYDRRHVQKFLPANAGNPWGQFVSSYYVETLFPNNEPPSYGLDLYGGEPSWTLSQQAVQKVHAWLITQL